MMDFMETMHVLQFCRVMDFKSHSYIFHNPNFQRGKNVEDDFYKKPIDIKKLLKLKGTKRLSKNHHIKLFNRLQQLQKCDEKKMSRLEYARLRLKFTLQKRLDELNNNETYDFDCPTPMPSYYKKKEIAGYYGHVPMDLLKNKFGNYFPILESQDAAPIETVNIVAQEEELIIDVVNVPTPRTIQPSIQSNGNCDAVHEIMVLGDITNQVEVVATEIGEPPAKRARRSYKKKKFESQKITHKETADALMYLQKELGATENKILGL
jgi:hypothetical protein